MVQCTWPVAWLLCWLLLLTGCAPKQPKTLPLTSAEDQEAAALWSTFTGADRPEAMDADIRLGWDLLGSKGTVQASVQVQQPGLLRFAANDPLGRALILAVADSTSFLMIDNRIGHVYQGNIPSTFWHTYVPATVAVEDLLPLLGGFLPEGQGLDAWPSLDEAKGGFWYRWRDQRAVDHRVLLDRQTGTMQRHLLFDGTGDLLVVLDYDDYGQENTDGFGWPRSVRITGKAVTGTLTVRVEQMYSHSPQTATSFRLTPPPHFTVEQVP